MARSELGELVVNFRADNADLTKKVAELEKSLARAERSVGKNVDAITGRVAGMAAGFVSVAAAVAVFTRALDRTNTITQLSQQTGIATESLSALAHQAELNQVSTEKLGAALGTLGRQISEAQDRTSTARVAFNLLDIAFQEADGSARSVEAVFRDMADRFATSADGANKVAIAMQLMGEGGRQLIPIMNGGGDAALRVTDEMRKLGIVVDSELSQRTREAHIQMVQLRNVFDGLANDAIRSLGPALEWLGGVFRGFFANMEDGNAKLATFFHNMRATALITAAREAKTELESLGQKMVQLNTQREQAFNNREPTRGFSNEIVAIQERMTVLRAEIDGFNEQLRQMGAIAVQSAGAVQGLLSGPTKSRPEPQDQLGSIRDQQEALRLINEQLAATQDRLSGLPMLMQAAFGDTGAWAPAFLEAMAQVDNAVAKGAISAERAAAMKLGLQRKEQDAVLDTATAIGQTITAVFGQSKGAAIAAAIMNTGVAITKTLSAYPAPYNFAMAALVAAQGAAQIASIRSTTKEGTGGTAAPSTTAAAAPAEGGMNNTLTVQGLGGADWIRGDTLRDLLDAIADKQRDGYKVVVAPR